MLFDDLKPGALVRGLSGHEAAEVVAAVPFGPDALNIVFRTDGKVAERLIYRGEESTLSLADAGRAFAFDGDGEHFRLASEAQRVRLAHLFDRILR